MSSVNLTHTKKRHQIEERLDGKKGFGGRGMGGGQRKVMEEDCDQNTSYTCIKILSKFFKC